MPLLAYAFPAPTVPGASFRIRQAGDDLLVPRFSVKEMVMMKSMFHCTLALAACSLLAMPAFAAPRSIRTASTPHATTPHHAAAKSGKQKVTIAVLGADSAQAAAITKALADNGLQAKIHEGKGKAKAMHLTAEIDPGADLSQWSKVIGASMPKGQTAPTLQLVIYAPITKETGTLALAQLEKVKGVDVKHSAANVKNGELRVGLNGNDHVTANDISSAVQSAGVTGHFTKMTRGRAS
jgi:hypothetical protein